MRPHATGIIPRPGDEPILVDPAIIDRCARLAMAGIQREYPNQLSLVLHSDADLRPPRRLTPAFFGCYDWHSAVHGHWCLVRLLRTFPEAAWAAEARAVLNSSLTADNLAAELTYLSGAGREGFERPYGLTWLLQLATDLRTWDDDEGRLWLDSLQPLEQLAVQRLANWLPRLTHPIRSGEHSQTAFAMGLALDWAHTAGDAEFESLLSARALDFHRDDRDAPLLYEPSGHDFLSPALAEADLLRRVLPPGQFASWLDGFLPQLADRPATNWLRPVLPTDVTDGKLAHLDGLLLSRTWMLEGIISGLPAKDPRRPALQFAATAHRTAGLARLSGEHYALTHWIGSFAVYLLTH